MNPQPRFDPYTGQPIVTQRPQPTNPYPSYHPTNQIIDARMSEFEERVMAAIEGKKPQPQQAQEQQQFTLDLSPTTNTIPSIQYNKGMLKGMFIPVTSVQEALSYKAPDGISWVQGEPLYFENATNKEFYKTWFDANASPSHCIEIYAYTPIDNASNSNVPTPEITPILEKMQGEIAEIKNMLSVKTPIMPEIQTISTEEEITLPVPRKAGRPTKKEDGGDS